jgi:hypothetical protein
LYSNTHFLIIIFMSKRLAVAVCALGLGASGSEAFAHTNAHLEFNRNSVPNAQITGARGEPGFQLISKVIDPTRKQIMLEVLAGRSYTVQIDCPDGWQPEGTDLPEGSTVVDASLFDQSIDNDGEAVVRGLAPRNIGDSVSGVVRCVGNDESGDVVEQPLKIEVEAVGLDVAAGEAAHDQSTENSDSRMPYRLNHETLVSNGGSSGVSGEFEIGARDAILTETGGHNFGIFAAIRAKFLHGLERFGIGVRGGATFANDGEEVRLPNGGTERVQGSAVVGLQAEAGWMPEFADFGDVAVGGQFTAGVGFGYVTPTETKAGGPVDGEAFVGGGIGAGVTVGNDDVTGLLGVSCEFGKPQAASNCGPQGSVGFNF